jgi:hypothetical protein
MKNNKQQTAVEWLEIEVKKFNTVITKEYILLLCQQAKEMEKVQIIDAYWHGYKNDIHFDDLREDDGEIWYNETYGGNK